MNGIIGVGLCVTGAVTFAVLVRNGYTERMDIVGWFGATLCTVGGLMMIVGYAFDVGIGVPPDTARSIATFISVILALGTITAATIYALRKRQPATFDTGPVTPRNFVGGGKTYAWGEWNHNDVKTARANASRIRKGVRA